MDSQEATQTLTNLTSPPLLAKRRAATGHDMGEVREGEGHPVTDTTPSSGNDNDNGRDNGAQESPSPRVTKPPGALAQSPLVLSNLAQILSSQGVLMQTKSEQEIMRMIEGIIKKRQCILNCEHVRVLQGAIEMDLFVVSSLTLPQPNHKPLAPVPHSPLAAQREEARLRFLRNDTLPLESYETIEQAIIKIFRYHNFHKDNIMANSPLHNLRIVRESSEYISYKQSKATSTLSEHNKATILREFLIKWLDEEFCPTPGNCPPKNWLELPFVPKSKWIEYLILRWQYVDRHSREQVLTELEKNNCQVTGGTYTRHLKAARVRLADLIWQKEKRGR
jgi:hypothetical protein